MATTTEEGDTSLKRVDVDEPSLIPNQSALATVYCANTDDVLETIDSVVACATGVELQHEYELQKVEEALRTEERGLTDREAALVRLQIMEKNAKLNDPTMFAFPDIDDMIVCGTELADDKPAFFPKETTATDSKAGVLFEAERSTDFPKLHCAICFDEADQASSPKTSSVTFAYLPCCGADGKEETSTTKVCTACMLLLSSPTSDSNTRIGRCPRCRSWISVSTSNMPLLSILPVTTAGKCQICNQTKAQLVENAAVCDACFLGRRRPLVYECKECRGRQMIPHPMYRYQDTIADFGTTSWACQGRCQNFTMWRILFDQVKLIPAGDAPEEWGEDYLEVARERVMEARRGIFDCDPNVEPKGWSESCATM